MGVKAAAVKVNWDTTVLAAEVRTAATSGVGSEGVAAAPQAESNTAMRRMVRVVLIFMLHPIIEPWSLYFKVYRKQCAEIIAIVALHSPCALIFARRQRGGQWDSNIDAGARRYKIFALLEYKIDGINRLVAADEDEFVSIIPGASASVFDGPNFYEVLTGF